MSWVRIWILILLMCSISRFEIRAQENLRNEIRMWGGPKLSKESTFFGSIRGGISMHKNIGYEFGLEYSRQLKKRIWLSSGLSYFNSTNKFTSFTFTPVNYVLADFKIISVPVGIGFYLKPWIKLKCGISYDYQFNKETSEYFSNQTGLGCFFAPDFVFKLPHNYNLTFTPGLSHYSINKAFKDSFSDKLLTYGILCGIAKKF